MLKISFKNIFFLLSYNLKKMVLVAFRENPILISQTK